MAKKEEQQPTQLTPGLDEYSERLNPENFNQQDEQDDFENTEEEMSPAEKRLAEIESQLKEYKDENKRLNDNLVRMATTQPQPVQPQAVHQPEMPQLPDKAPDPIEDPDGYARYMETKQEIKIREIQQNIENKYNEKLQNQNDQMQYMQLKNRFQQKYPDLSAQNFDFIEHIAVKKIKKAAADRLDVNQYVYGNMDGFIDEVAREVMDQTGRKSDQSSGADRTAGLGGGATAAAPRKAPAKREKGFVASFKEIRANTPGLFRANPYAKNK